MDLAMETDRKHARAARCTALLAATWLGCAGAGEAEPQYTLNAIFDEALGEDVVAGNYDRAIEAIDLEARHWIDRFYAANNLCVALVATRRFEAARPVCDEALALIVPRADGKRSRHYGAEREYERLAAIALSNRGVLNALTGNNAAAKDDFEDARAMGVRLEAPAVNLARLGMDGEPSA